MNKIFAYGSLINESDLRRTVPEARNIIPAKLYGYKRVFDLVSTYRFDPQTGIPICVLNLHRASSSDFVNGISFEMDDSSFDDLLEREKAYELVESNIYDYYDSNIFCKANFFISIDYDPYSYLLDSELQQHYLSLCLQGCYKYGDNFIEDFKKTTFFFGVEYSQYQELIWKNVLE